MKRRNAECGKLRRPLKRNKITEGIYGSTLLYLKFLILWALVLLADFILEFRFEFLWPFWLLLRSVYDSFKYQGLAFSVFFICIALTSDMICFFFIPVHWLFFAASTYVWVQYVWHTEKGICLPTVILWLLFVYIEAAVRLRDLRHMPFHLDLCRPFAAHCIGYPVVTLGFGFKSYVGYRMRQRKQKDVAKENEFYMQLLQQALPLEPQPQSQSCHNTHTEKSKGATNAGETVTVAAVSNGNVPGSVGHTNSGASKNSHRKSLDKGESATDVSSGSGTKAEKIQQQQQQQRFANGSVPAELEFIERVGRKVQDALLAVVVKPRGGGNSGGHGGHHTNSGSGNTGNSTANGKPASVSSTAASTRRTHSSINDFDVNEVEKVDKSAKGSVAASLAQSSQQHSAPSSRTANGAPGTKWAHQSVSSGTHQHHRADGNNNPPTTLSNNNNNNSSGSSNAPSRRGKANREQPQADATQKDEYALRLEADIKRLKADLQGSRQSEQELRAQVAVLAAGDRNQRNELSQLHLDNDELQSKLHGLVSARAADKQSMNALERRLAEERRARAGAEAALAAERKAKRAEEAAAARALALAHHHHQQQQQQHVKQECSDSCRARRRDLETEGKALRRELKLCEERVITYEREIQSLRQYKENHNDAEILMSALSAMQDKNAHLENSLSAETRIKLDLFSALGEAKRQLEIKECIIRAQEKELDELKAKMAQVLAVMPTESPAFAPVTAPPTPLQTSKLRLPPPSPRPMPPSSAQSLGSSLSASPLSSPLLAVSPLAPLGSPVTEAAAAAAAAAAACALQQQQSPCPGCTASTLDPNATAYTPKGVGIGLVASTEA